MFPGQQRPATECIVSTRKYDELIAIKERLKKDLSDTEAVLHWIDCQFKNTEGIVPDKILKQIMIAEDKHNQISEYLGIPLQYGDQNGEKL